MTAETEIKRGMVTYTCTCTRCKRQLSLVANNKRVARFLYESVGWVHDDDRGWECVKCVTGSADE